MSHDPVRTKKDFKEITRRGRCVVTCEFDPGKSILFVSHPVALTLSTAGDIDDYYGEVRNAWYRLCNGRRIFAVVDLTNLLVDVDASLSDYHARSIRTAEDECAIATVRYGGSMLQRTMSRMAAIGRSERSNVCRSRDEAIALVRELQQRGAASPESRFSPRQSLSPS